MFFRRNSSTNISFLNRPLILLFLLIFICISIAFSFIVIKDFSDPLAGSGDTTQWEYIGFFVERNLHFTPLPKLDFINNQVFYPYGTNSVFQTWGLERDFFFSIFHSLFGNGPWLQLYYLLTVLITALGTFALLVSDYGLARAGGAGLIVSFFNFYTIRKYPGHLNIAVAHWTTLSFITDFLIVKRVVLRQDISLRLVLIRICLLFFGLGQDLGYIAGLALTSFTVSIIFIFVISGYRFFKGNLRLLSLFKRIISNYTREFSNYPFLYIFLLCLTILVAYLYLPLVLQISREAKSYDLAGAQLGFQGVLNPLRLLIPFFPFFNPGLPLQKLFLDLPEGNSGGMSPGWFLLIIGITGLIQARKQISIFIPCIVILVLCLLFQPLFLPTLKIFPWFAFNRVSGRSTAIFPVILCLFALHINLTGLRMRSRWLISALLVALACTELFTAYSLHLNNYQPYKVEKSFLNYMDYIKKQPGEAVLDWPFCVTGGNGMGDDSTAQLCPFDNKEVYSLRRFHEKKVMGQYFGRLHPDQYKPYLQAGWNEMLLNSVDSCFSPAEWSFFTDFYTYNDFAGINLYEDILPASCVEQFYARFGTPTIEAEVPGSGKVKFIPKSPDLRAKVNLNQGKNIRLNPFLDTSASNLLQVDFPPGMIISGLTKIEQNPQDNNYRWGREPSTELSFALAESQPLVLRFKLKNLFNGQNIIVEINQKKWESIPNIQTEEVIERQIEFPGIKGMNDIKFKYEKEMSFSEFLKSIVILIKEKGITGINFSNIKKLSKSLRFKNAVEFTELVIASKAE